MASLNPPGSSLTRATSATRTRGAPTMTVGVRLSYDEIARMDVRARAAGLDRSDYMRRTLLGRKIGLHPAEHLLAEAVSLFATMRVSVQIDRPERLAESFARLDAIMDRLCLACGEDGRG